MILSVFVLSACDIDVNETQLASSDQLVAPVLSAISGVVIDQNTDAVEEVSFTWEEPYFGASVQIQYNLMVKSGTTSALLGQSFSNFYTISKDDFNGIIVNQLGVKANSSADVKAYVTASVYGTVTDTLTSNTIEFNVSTYKAQLKPLYMTGAYASWDAATANKFWETTGGSAIYKNLIDVNVTDNTISFFKILTAQNWSDANYGNDFLTSEWELPGDDGNNLSVNTESGSIAEFTVNLTDNTIDRTMYSAMGIIGAFTSDGTDHNWDYDLEFTYDLANNCWNTQVATFAENAEFKIRMNKGWTVSYGGPLDGSDDIEGGYELTGGDNIAITEAGDYFFTLYTNRTPWVLVMNKQ